LAVQGAERLDTGAVTLKLIISVTHHSMGKSTVTQNLTAALSSPDQAPMDRPP